MNGYSDAKLRLDRALPGMKRFVFHDLRRTFRTILGDLDIPPHVAEAMIAHSQRGIERVYNRHDYRQQMRRGFELFEARLDAILSPRPPGTVTDIASRRVKTDAA